MATAQKANARYKPPYTSEYHLLGGMPSVVPDVPINAVFLLLFLVGAVGHAWQYRINIIRGRKFIPSAAAFAFCVTRVFTAILWMIWACHPNSIECEIASLIFGYVGIIALFIVDLLFARRIVRGQHPRFGWTLKFSIPFTILFIIIVATIICLIVAIVIMFYTRSRGALHSSLEIQRYGATLYAIMSFLPMLIVSISALARRIPKIRMTSTIDKFGEGSMRTKVAIVIITSLLLSAGSIYRAAVMLASPTPVTQAVPGYLSKACFYVFTFTIEFAIVLFWLVVRIDRRFYVPDGAWGPHSYAGGFVFAGEPGNEKSPKSLGGRLNRQSLANPISASAGSHGSWATADGSPQFSDSVSRISYRSKGSTVANDLGQPAPVAHTSSGMSQLSHASRFSASRLSVSRASLRASIAESRRRNSAMREKTISWGGVTRDQVRDGLGENRGEIVPYAGFRVSPTSESSVHDADADTVTAADVGVEGPGREMGWDPKSGKWALRPLVRPAESSTTSLATSSAR